MDNNNPGNIKLSLNNGFDAIKRLNADSAYLPLIH
jgi:hypothetical protein